MNIQIIPTILQGMHDANYSSAMGKKSMYNHSAIRPTIEHLSRFDSCERIRIHSNISTVSSAISKIKDISSVSVRKQAIELLLEIQSSLSRSYMSTGVLYTLPQIMLNELDDLSALVEWNFKSLRVGFSIELNPNESSYYVITDDMGNGGFQSVSNGLGNNRRHTIQVIVDYVLRNT